MEKQLFIGLSNKPTVIIDRDGTINLDYGYTYKIEDLVILEECVEFLTLAVALDFQIVIATNQGGVALKKYSIDEMKMFNSALVADLFDLGIPISAVYSCIHHPKSPFLHLRMCTCRKPEPGLYKAIISDCRLVREDILVVGNSSSDIDAAKNLSLKGMLVNSAGEWTRALDELEIMWSSRGHH